MKTLVVYHTRTGHTKKLAEEIAKKLGADIEEIVDAKNRKGIIGWILAGRDATKQRMASIAPAQHDPAQYDLVAVGTPIWAWTMTPAIRTYLTRHKASLKKVAFFCTMGGSGGAKAFSFMEELCGQKPAAALELNMKELSSGNYSDKLDAFVAQLTR